MPKQTAADRYAAKKEAVTTGLDTPSPGVRKPGEYGPPAPIGRSTVHFGPPARLGDEPTGGMPGRSTRVAHTRGHELAGDAMVQIHQQRESHAAMFGAVRSPSTGMVTETVRQQGGGDDTKAQLTVTAEQKLGRDTSADKQRMQRMAQTGIGSAGQPSANWGLSQRAVQAQSLRETYAVGVDRMMRGKPIAGSARKGRRYKVSEGGSGSQSGPVHTYIDESIKEERD
jgi:hypothetical protein